MTDLWMKMKKVLIICNATSGKRMGEKYALYLQNELVKLGFEVETKITQRIGHATELAKQATVEDVEQIFCVSGDGTINEVAHGLIETDRLDIPLALIPTGVGNLFAKEIGIDKFRFFNTLLIAIHGEPMPIDIFKVKCADTPERIMFGCIGVGFDSAVIEEFQSLRKNIAVDKGTYSKIIKKMGFRKDWALLKVFVDDKMIEEKTIYWVVGANTRAYGGPFVFSPGASNKDGKLDVVVFEKPVNKRKIKYFMGLSSGTILKNSWASLYRGAKVRIESNPESPVQVDGEYAGKTPVDIAYTNKQILIVGPKHF